MYAAIDDVLRCPATGAELVRDRQRMTTVDGSHSYPIVGGVPILVDSTRSVFSPDEVAAAEPGEKPGSLARRLLERVVPGRDLSTSIGTAGRFDRFTEAVRGLGSPNPRVLVIGGGRLGDGMDALAASTDITLVETDVYLTSRVDVVCDGHQLPFADGTFDGVVLQAVLEHVIDPVQVVAEAHRVLRPGGIVYAETPFISQVHDGAFDFTRWTESGHRRLFRMFDEIEGGAVQGPGAALLWSLCYFARSLPPAHTRAVVILEKLTEALFFWLKYVDLLIIDHPGAIDAAAGVFFLGRRADAPVSDAEIVAGYRGIVGRPAPRRG